MARSEAAAARCGRLQDWLRQAGASAGLVTAGTHFTYLTGFYSPYAMERLTALLLPAAGEPLLLVPALDRDAARSAWVADIRTWSDGQDPWQALAGLAAERGVAGGRWAVDRRHLTLATADLLRQAVPGVELLDLGPEVARMRLIKDAGEIALIEAAAGLLTPVLAQLQAQMRVGMTERQLGRLVRNALEAAGSERPSFDGIVLAGETSAMPHGLPGDRPLRPGDLVVADFGGVKGGYCSDVTRTFAIGGFSAEQARIYDTVLTASRAALAVVRPGTAPEDVDRVARSVIESAGYGPYFTHRVGHGLGMDVHEGPWMSPGSRAPLEPGMVLTIEPGIYLPGVGGVRIEDMVLVTADGARVLTRYPAEREAMVIPV